MNDKHRDPLDQALDSLPRDVHPARDLWAGISAEISASASVTAPPRHSVTSSWMRLAAGFVLIVASSVTTYVITQRAADERVQQAQQIAATQVQQAPAVAVMPASWGGQQALGAEYLRARTALDAEFQRQIATLPPVTRARLERNLADLRRAASEISATLAEHPSHPLLQELLLSTYQSELALLGSVTNLSVPTLNQPPSETRL
ncbi:MAG TPA: hypothetical protein VIT67_22060 [Povalibacter sp.]